jgi:hypothetical protein
MTLSNVTIDGKNSDDLFVDIGESTAIQVDNFDDLLRRSLDRDSYAIHESVDSWSGDENYTETIEVDEDYWMFDVNSNGLWGLG